MMMMKRQKATKSRRIIKQQSRQADKVCKKEGNITGVRSKKQINQQMGFRV